MTVLNKVRQSIRLKITLMIVLPLIIILGTITLIDYNTNRNLMLNGLSEIAAYSGEIVNAALRHGMIDNDTNSIQQILDGIKDHSNFKSLYIMNTAGQIVFSPHRENQGLRLDNTSADCSPCHSYPAADRPRSIVVQTGDGEKVFRSMQPILNLPECYQCHDPADRINGELLIDIPIAGYNQALMVNLRKNLILWGGVIVLTSAIVYIALNNMVINGIKHLVDDIKGFSLGRRETRKPTRIDEIGQLESALIEMVDEIDRRQSENQILTQGLEKQNRQRKELLNRLITAQEDERKRLARDLHDDLGQTLSGVGFLTEGIEQLFATDPDRALQQVPEIRNLINESTEKMYDLIMDLRPSILDDLGFIPATKRLAERVLKDKPIDFEFHAEPFDTRLPPEIETCIYRVVQEAISNCLKHANATSLSIDVSSRDGMVQCTIEDNGAGFDPQDLLQENGSNHGYGILGMQERIAQCGGSFEIQSQLDRGTCIKITIPIKEDLRAQ